MKQSILIILFFAVGNANAADWYVVTNSLALQSRTMREVFDDAGDIDQIVSEGMKLKNSVQKIGGKILSVSPNESLDDSFRQLINKIVEDRPGGKIDFYAPLADLGGEAEKVVNRVLGNHSANYELSTLIDHLYHAVNRAKSAMDPENMQAFLVQYKTAQTHTNGVLIYNSRTQEVVGILGHEK